MSKYSRLQNFDSKYSSEITKDILKDASATKAPEVFLQHFNN